MKINRRELIEKSAQLALGAAWSNRLLIADAPKILAPSSDSQSNDKFPPRFLWGAATAAHQVEGNNVNSDNWLVEHQPNSMYKEPSGDACDQYHLYEQDINMVADLGFNAYRFSIEWARIEPEKGFFSRAELEHYRRMLEACHRRGLTPLVTYSHFTLPRWFAFQGAWENADCPDLFARYCEKATAHLGDLISYAATFNEPDLPYLFRWITPPGMPPDSNLAENMASQKPTLRQQLKAPMFSGFLIGDAQKTHDNIMTAHTKAKSAIKTVKPRLPVGFTLAMEDDQPVGPNSRATEKQAEVYGPWLKLAKQDDFLGVQTYTRQRIGAQKVPPPENAELTQVGNEFYPEALEHTVRYASQQAGVPVIVTENGVATENDSRRVEYIQRALAGLKRCLDDGVDVRGYIHWSLLDNFEWTSGYRPKFGLVSVDHETQKRTIKPSATMLGRIAKNNSLS